jgi:hypothetical protein
MLARVGLSDDVRRIADAAEHFAGERERVEAVLPAEPAAGARIYLVAFSANGAAPSWLAFDGDAEPVTSRDRVREAVSIAAMVEVAEDGVLDEALPPAPRLASPRYLDELGAAGGPELGAAIQGAVPAVDELAKDVEANYKLELT